MRFIIPRINVDTRLRRETDSAHRARVDERLPVHAHIPPLAASALEAFRVGHVQVDAVEAAQTVRAGRQDAPGQAAAVMVVPRHACMNRNGERERIRALHCSGLARRRLRRLHGTYPTVFVVYGGLRGVVVMVVVAKTSQSNPARYTEWDGT